MKRAWTAALICAAAGTLTAATLPYQSDSASCAQYETAEREVREGEFDAALQSLQRVIKGCQQRDRQAMGWVLAGRIGLMKWPMDLAGAREAAERLTGSGSPYLETPSAADGFILKGTIEILEGRNFAKALTEFKRVDDKLTKSTTALAIAEATYRIGEAERLNHQPEAALVTFMNAAMRYPRSEWAARALLSAAYCQTQLGQFQPAMELLQRVRRDAANLPEAELALQRNSILYRLDLKGSPQELVPVMTAKKRYRDGVALGTDKQGRLLLAHRAGFTTLNPDSGDELPADSLPANDSFGVSGIGMWGNVVAISGERQIVRNSQTLAPIRPTVAKPDGTEEDVELSAFVTTWRGDWLIADRKSGAIRRYLPDGKAAGLFVQRMKAERMVQNDIDDVAVLDADQKGVVIYGRDGSSTGQILRRSPDRHYDFGDPVDVAFDVLGNVYVLDGGRNNIVVFDPRLQFRTILSFPLKTVKKPVAITIDPRGRIYVFDRDLQQLFGYQ